jgi:hypothetical protein
MMPPASMPSSSTPVFSPPHPSAPLRFPDFGSLLPHCPVPNPQSLSSLSSSPTLRLPLRSKNLTLRDPASKSQSVRTILRASYRSRTILTDYFASRIQAPNPHQAPIHDTFVRTGEDSTSEYRGPHFFGPSQSRRPSQRPAPCTSTKPRPGGPTGGLVDEGSKEPSLAVVPKQVSQEEPCEPPKPLSKSRPSLCPRDKAVLARSKQRQDHPRAQGKPAQERRPSTKRSKVLH